MSHTDLPTDESQQNGGDATATAPEMPPPVGPAVYYTVEGEEDEQPGAGDERGEQVSAAFRPPFELTGAMPYVEAKPPQGNGSAKPAWSFRGGRKFPWLRVALACLAILVLLGSLALLSAFAKTGMPAVPRSGTVSAPQATATHPQTVPTPQRSRGNTPTPRPVASPTATPQGVSGVPSGQLLLPVGWTAAGLTIADAIEAERTAATFTDREESLVFNAPGTRTAAEFLLTPAARNRFAQFDVRVATDVLWNSVQQRQLIQLAWGEQPTLAKFATQGQQQFAWVDVQFELWRSQIDPQQPNRRVAGLERDPATGGPRLHHMIVLLLHLAPGSQGTGAPMGGTGWLVSTYALDPGTLPDGVFPA